MAAVALAAVSAADAAPTRTATTTSYTTATYLQHALGLPASDTAPAIEPVTYDRFQWLLQQSGDLAVLIGDPATDATFEDRAQDVEAQAKDAGVKKVYWFNPNLSGNAKVGDIVEPNLDIRDPAGITTLDATSQAKYDNAWKALVGQYLGNGLKVVQNDLNSEKATVTVTDDASVVNDASGSPLYKYTGGTAPTSVKHSFFFIYNKDHVDGGDPDKIVAWTDLTTQADSTSTTDDVGEAIDAVGAAQIARIDQFAWWKSEVNAKQHDQAPGVASGGALPVLTDADADDWRIEQITYPELVDLLENGADTADAVILFGGTWCPNTRPVLPRINQQAKDNDVRVYNFDTVLDGGLVGGSTTQASDPLQTRNTFNNSSTTTYANPSFLYGDLVNQHLTNIKTDYGPIVTYYPGGDHSGTPTPAASTARKLQVPFLIGYQGSAGSAAHGGVTRQWIIDNKNGTYSEYMSSWAYTNPQRNQLNITTIPLDAPIWTKINDALASFTWQSDPTKLYANSGIDTDDADFLVTTDTASVSYDAGTSKWTIASGGPIPANPAALSAALDALGSSAPSKLSEAKIAWLAAQAATPQDPTLIGRLNTIVGAWGVAQLRKTKVTNTWGSATNPGSVAGGLAALHAVDVFFGGLPGGVVSHRTVSADSVTVGTAPKITIKVANDYGRVPTGAVSLVVKQGGTTVASTSAAVAQDEASFTLPALGAGTYDYTLSYPGDDQLLAFTETGTLTVTPAPAGPDVIVDPAPSPGPGPGTTPPTVNKPPVAPPAKATRVKVSKVKGAVAKAPTSKKVGKYKVTISTPKGATAAGGKVTVKLQKGKVTKTLTGTLKGGVVTVTLPKLARGTWKVTITWPGDTRYLKASAAGASIKVIK